MWRLPWRTDRARCEWCSAVLGTKAGPTGHGQRNGAQEPGGDLRAPRPQNRRHLARGAAVVIFRTPLRWYHHLVHHWAFSIGLRLVPQLLRSDHLGLDRPRLLQLTDSGVTRRAAEIGGSRGAQLLHSLRDQTPPRHVTPG